MPSWRARTPRRHRTASGAPYPFDHRLLDGERVAIAAATPAGNRLQRRAPARRPCPADSLVETEALNQLRLVGIHPRRRPTRVLNRGPLVERVRERVPAPREIFGDRRARIGSVVKERDLKVRSERAQPLGY